MDGAYLVSMCLDEMYQVTVHVSDKYERGENVLEDVMVEKIKPGFCV